MATRKVKWTSKADNGRKFTGKARDRESSSVSRQFKKPRQAGRDTVLQTNAIVEGGTVDKSRDFWYIESSSRAMVTPLVVEKEAIDSDDCEEDNIPIAQTRTKEKATDIVEEEVSSDDELLLPETGVQMSPKMGLLGIGTEVMRQFDEGLFTGTVQSYDRKTNLYKILYSDGDGEDVEEDEYVYAYQLAMANGGDANDLSSRDSADEESAYQLPKKVK
jgi:hypothetical protein